MTPEAARAFMLAVGSTKFDKSTLPWLSADCPLAPWKHQSGVDRHPSFGILTGKHKVRCHCFSCGFSGSPETLIAEMLIRGKRDHGMDIKEADRILEEQDPGLLDLSEEPEEKRGPWDTVKFPLALWLSFPPVLSNSPGHLYLQSRGITDDEIAKYSLRWDSARHRVCFPVFGHDGNLYGVRGRAIAPGPNEPRYWSYHMGGITNPQVWFGEDWADLDKPVLVVESVFDTVAARRVYPNTIAPLSATITVAQAERVAGGFLFVHLFDGDKAGSMASARLRKLLPNSKHIIRYLPDREDPDSMVRKFGVEALAEIIRPVLESPG